MKEINAVTLDNVAYIAGQPGSIKPVNKGSASFDSFMDISTKTNTGNVQADVQPKQDAVQKVQVADQAASQKQPVKGMEDASSTQDNNNIVEDVALVQSVNDKITDVVKMHWRLMMQHLLMQWQRWVLHHLTCLMLQICSSLFYLSMVHLM